MSSNEARELVDARGLAEMAGVTLRTVRNWTAAGCPCVSLGPTVLRYDAARVFEWSAEQRRQRRSERMRKVIGLRIAEMKT